MRRWVGLLAAAALLVSCAPAAAVPTGNTVNVKLTDNKIFVDRVSVPPGTYTVVVANTGAIGHSVDLVKSDAAHDRLPPDPNDASRVQLAGLVKQTGLLSPGKSVSFSADLAAGSYVFLCNEPAHYLIGMHVPLQVK